MFFNWRRQPTPVLLPGKSHGWRSLVGCSPWGLEELDTSLVAPWHVESSWTRDQTCVPCVGRWSLSYWSIREVQRHTVTWRKQHRGISLDCCEFRYKEGRYILVFTCIYRKTISKIFLKELVRVVIYWRKVGTGWMGGRGGRENFDCNCF